MSTPAHHVVNDVTGLNPVRVMAIVAPESVEDVQEAMRRTTGPVSIGGGRFSMGGQTASPGSLHIDMRSLNGIVAFSPTQRTIRVQAGVRWCDIQRFIDPHGLSVKIMQTYANFTVGGALSVNCHGRYVGLGPLVLSVMAIRVVLHDGSAVEATREHNADLFRGAIGGYGALGVIVEVELALDINQRVERTDAVMPLSAYWSFFKDQVRNNPAAVFHNADLYAPHYSSVRAVTWCETSKPATVPDRLQTPGRAYPLHQYFLWSVSETPLGKERREKLIDPLLYLRSKVHWRNYEAGYDVAELEPPSRMHRTYVLQEYFVPVERLLDFVPRMAEILNRHRVNALNISIRHAMPDKDTVLAWAPTETFAFVLYHKQRTRENARRRVAVWTRELIDAALSVGGTYYLPYQPHATHEQFHRAYPRARELFELKRRLDPQGRFTNALWDQYWPGAQPSAPARAATAPPLSAPAGHEIQPATDFHRVFGDTRLSDAFYLFLQNVFHTAPEDRFHHLIAQATARHTDEESIYREIQRCLPGIKPAAADLRYALPALFTQKAEMTRQTLEVLPRRAFDGYLEIGSKGRYYGGLAKALTLTGDRVFVEERPQSNSPVDILERGRLSRIGRHFPLADYAPLPDAIASDSIGLVTCYIGLHHMTVDKLRPFLRSVLRVMKPGGAFIVRDHDVQDENLGALVSLAHTVFNAGLGETWDSNRNELRYFASAQDWVAHLATAGFVDTGHRLLQANDPTLNTLFCFIKPDSSISSGTLPVVEARPSTDEHAATREATT
ncbi:FAD/FMN-containing dehydrogenase [Roseateles sp. YR242]|uniref:FAD-binding protein n=1 Tax=Roseateles sp. YR242 TaxID=1855305 RepID=UPI0008C7BAD4|nr:FAD-binding protein [Roseateles sp. YR242]SEL87656.1 FAD/FMN-containing dehydrogenase [Roseateles sp. YR242]